RTHAIGLTLVRLAVTRRRLLEWETAAATAAKSATWVGGSGLRRFVSEMIASPIIALATLLLILITRPDAIVSALPILLLWVLAPGAAYWLSLPARLRLRPLDASQRALLRRTARRTWRYFETFVTEADGWLPPDNFQESGETPQLARRTSPTNI